jgi:trk system potassium uptake protein TrkH
MRWRYIAYVLGTLVLCFGLTMTVPLAFALYFRDASILPLVSAMAVSIVVGLLLFFFLKQPRVTHISQREGMAIVALGWTAVGLFGALPFYFQGDQWSFVDAFFESVSGFTTTGASILSNIEVLPRGLLLWRSFIQWLGGMGIIVLSIAILPFLGVGGMQLYKAEVPSPVPDKLRPRIRDTATVLWKVYAAFSFVQVVLLMFGGMSFFDALCHAFTTMPTGGFSTKNASMAHFDSVYLDVVVLVFMVMAGINFSLHYQLIRGRSLAVWKDAELRFFLGLLVVLVFLVSTNLYLSDFYETIGKALRYGAFQVVSIVTTTGYATADYEQWPALSQLILFLCMFIGASAGSTGGGVKILRLILGFKYCYKELFLLIHPRAVAIIKIGKRTVPEDVMRSVLGFLVLYVGLFAFCAVALAGLGVDFMTALGATASAIGNVGPGFGIVGPVENYSQIPYLGKWLLIWCMLLGRLEIYTVLILLVPEFWRR